jgi:hypothetical protein
MCCLKLVRYQERYSRGSSYLSPYGGPAALNLDRQNRDQRRSRRRFVAGMRASHFASEKNSPSCWQRSFTAFARTSLRRKRPRPAVLSGSTTPCISPRIQDNSSCGPRFSSSSSADARLRMWVKGQKPGFDSFGACRPANGGLSCEGSLSAAEADVCTTDNDGVHAIAASAPQPREPSASSRDPTA